MATLVKFRKPKDKDFENDIAAVFPQTKYNRALYGNDTYLGYAHIGQHTAVLKEWVDKDTVPANESEYRALKEELEGIGYILKVVN